MTVHTGINEAHRAKVVKVFSQLLADSYLLYLKTQNYHWNVKGPNFKSLHALFEEQYQDLQEAVDEIAERIRGLGHAAPGSFAEFAQLSSLTEASKGIDATQMIKELLADHEAMAQYAHKLLAVTSEANDAVSESLLNDRLAVHEKTAWMLRSSL